MALHIIVESSSDSDRRWRAEVDPDDGWTRLFDGRLAIASAWFCPPNAWTRVEPDAPAIHGALGRVAHTLDRLGFSPVRSHAACERDGEDCEAE